MSTKTECLNSGIFTEKSVSFERSPRPKKLRRHDFPTPKQRKEDEQRTSRQYNPPHTIATPQDVKDRIRFQIERFIELSNGGKLPPGWGSFAANHKEEIVLARKKST